MLFFQPRASHLCVRATPVRPLQLLRSPAQVLRVRQLHRRAHAGARGGHQGQGGLEVRGHGAGPALPVDLHPGGVRGHCRDHPAGASALRRPHPHRQRDLQHPAPPQRAEGAGQAQEDQELRQLPVLIASISSRRLCTRPRSRYEKDEKPFQGNFALS